jgi:hypothetical protein
VGNQRAPLFAIIGGVVLAVLLVVFLVLPEMGKVSKAKEDLAQAQQQEQTLTVQRNALEDTRANAAENRKIIEQVHQQIPPTVDEGGLFNLINKAALDSGFPIVNISPSTPTFDDSDGAQHHRAAGERRRHVQRRHGLHLPDRDVAARRRRSRRSACRRARRRPARRRRRR